MREVAGLLGVATSTVYQLCAEGKLVHLRVSNAIRVEREAVAAYVAESLLESSLDTLRNGWSAPRRGREWGLHHRHRASGGALRRSAFLAAQRAGRDPCSAQHDDRPPFAENHVSAPVSEYSALRGAADPEGLQMAGRLQRQQEPLDLEIARELLALAPERWAAVVLDVRYTFEDGIERLAHVATRANSRVDVKEDGGASYVATFEY